MVAKSELSLSELQKIAGEVRSCVLRNRPDRSLGHLEIAALLFRVNPARVIWSSSFSRSALHALYREIGERDPGKTPGSPIMRRPHSALGFAAGVAFEASLQGGKSCTCCCMSDTDQFLGGVWEAAIRSVKLRLGKLIAFVVESGPGAGFIADKYAACGWNVRFMNAAAIAEGFSQLKPPESEDIPSVIITQALEDDPESSALRSGIDSSSAETAFHEQISAILRGIEEVPGEARKVIFSVTEGGRLCSFPGAYGNTEKVQVVDCGPAAATAFSLARGVGEAGGTSFVARCSRSGFSLSGNLRKARHMRRIECPSSAREAEQTVRSLWDLDVPWEINIIRY